MKYCYNTQPQRWFGSFFKFTFFPLSKPYKQAEQHNSSKNVVYLAVGKHERRVTSIPTHCRHPGLGVSPTTVTAISCLFWGVEFGDERQKKKPKLSKRQFSKWKYLKCGKNNLMKKQAPSNSLKKEFLMIKNRQFKKTSQFIREDKTHAYSADSKTSEAYNKESTV